MNLFDAENYLEEFENFCSSVLIAPSVQNFLGIEAMQLAFEALKNTKRIAEENDTEYFPKESSVFRSFVYPSVVDSLVIIVSKCPYPNENADGIAFSCAEYPSPTLRQFYCALTDDPDIVDNDEYRDPEKFPYQMNLIHLVAQRVMLLNTKLAVLRGKPNSLSDIGWEDFIAQVVKKLSYKQGEKDPDKLPIFLLLGSDAQKRKITDNINPACIVHMCDHPVNAAKNNSYWQCDAFEKINQELARRSKPVIKWVRPNF